MRRTTALDYFLTSVRSTGEAGTIILEGPNDSAAARHAVSQHFKPHFVEFRARQTTLSESRGEVGLNLRQWIRNRSILENAK